MKCYPKHYGLIAYLDMVLLRLLFFELVYGHEAVLPIEVNLDAYRLTKQNDLSAVDYHDLMMDNIDKVTDKRLRALKEIKKISFGLLELTTKRCKSLQVGELVWKTILPLGTKNNKFGKWSPSW